MKQIFISSLIVLGFQLCYAEQGPREQFQQMNQGQDNRAKVEAIASEQGIDLSTHEGRRMMAQYLHQTGQQSLLPPRRQGRGGQQQQVGGQNNGAMGGENCNKHQGGRPRPAGPNRGGQIPTDS